MTARRTLGIKIKVGFRCLRCQCLELGGAARLLSSHLFPIMQFSRLHCCSIKDGLITHFFSHGKLSAALMLLVLILTLLSACLELLGSFTCPPALPRLCTLINLSLSFLRLKLISVFCVCLLTSSHSVFLTACVFLNLLNSV